VSAGAGRITGVGVGPGDPDLVTVRAARLIEAADVVAYHCAAHGHSIARAAAEPYLRAGQAEEVLRYPVTTEDTGHPGGYAGALADFYAEAGARLERHLLAGRDVAVLCEGDPSLYGSYLHLHERLRGRFESSIVPGVSSVSAAAAAAGVPLVQHDESLTVLPGTLPDGELRARLAAADAAAVLKLGRSFGKVRSAIEAAGMAGRACYVERAGTAGQRVAPLADVDPALVPYMSLALVAGRGHRPEPEPGVTVVGLGPGHPAWLTPEAAAALAAATDLVGYRPYLARVPVRPGQARHASGNTAEAERAALALDLAAAGRQVAVVSSGDPGVFAMASAVLEQAAADDDRWGGVPVTVLPGVTAAQAVAARAGAPLGHDYCVISLSDRLKPWPVIADRVAHAAAADLVLALYNPASRSRTWQLAAVADLLLCHRSPGTPVVVGRAVGQPGEQVQVITLAELSAAAVDMSTLVIVGSSTTRIHDRAGHPVVVTPRHYAGPGGRPPQTPPPGPGPGGRPPQAPPPGPAGAAASSRPRRRTQPAGHPAAAADA
jgi:precorrin-2 C20-methyltransferase / precorrin-3B C17-methyltransferase